MAEVLIAAAAETEYLESLLWYMQRSRVAAAGFEAEFDRVLRLIGEAPQRYPLCNRRHRRILMRRYPFQVVYRQEREMVVVIAVAHTSRGPRAWST
jgi:plasmid stabilization system protein ParE